MTHSAVAPDSDAALVARIRAPPTSLVVDTGPVAYTSTSIPGSTEPPTACTGRAGTLMAAIPAGTASSESDISVRREQRTSPLMTFEPRRLPMIWEESVTAVSGRRSATHIFVTTAEASTTSPAAKSRLATHTST